MVKVTYSEPELKEIIEEIVGKNFFIFCNEVVSQILSELNLPSRLMNKMVVLVTPHDDYERGIAYKEWYAIKLKIQDTLEDTTKTLIHEVMHLLKPTWDERTIEKATDKMYTKLYRNNTQEILI